ncbi:MAG: class II glutamine amidotransferase, partial [Pirellulaceae bacterium]
SVHGFQIRRSVGRIDRLADLLIKSPISGSTGIGHTRWATHGAATTENAHPHTGGRGQVAVVHNGVIENFEILKQGLMAKGYVFQSDTDTEVIAHLIADALKTSQPAEATTDGRNAVYLDAVREILPMLRGTYGLVVLFRDRPDLMIAARCGSPLVLGVGRGEQFIASDTSPLVGYTDRII